MRCGSRVVDSFPLRIALLSYRSKPHCGGQGVYVRHVSRELVELGHQVEVISGQPYPRLDAGPELLELPSLDLYREPDPFRIPRPREILDWIDALEFLTMGTGGFPEPLTFSLRAARLLKTRVADFDVVHDNQTLGYGMLSLQRAGLPLIATIHHPERVVVGTPNPDGPVARAVKDLNLGDVVRFVSGLSDEGLAELLGSAEIAVVPSLYEGFSIPALAALACATPLIATTGGALPEVAGEDAVLVKPGDPGEMADALEALFDDDNRPPALGEDG